VPDYVPPLPCHLNCRGLTPNALDIAILLAKPFRLRGEHLERSNESSGVLVGCAVGPLAVDLDAFVASLVKKQDCRLCPASCRPVIGSRKRDGT
jgi:hypothetical protein